MRISSKEIFQEENHGKITFETAGTTRLTLGGNGDTTLAGGVVTFTGSVVAGGASDTVGFFGATPVAAQATTATTGTYAAGTGTSANSGSSWVGNVGTKAYTMSDVISALKNYNLLTP